MLDVERALIARVLKNPEMGYNHITYRIKSAIMWDYYFATLRNPKIRCIGDRIVENSPQIQKEIVEELKKNNFDVIDFEIDVDDYHSYMRNAEYNKFPGYYQGGKAKKINYPGGKLKYFIEKSLEHYLAAKLLGLSKDDVYIDIANCNSPTPEIYQKVYGCQVYRQDLEFPEGIGGNVIGGDAGKMPLHDGFATKMALHCSFEHFEQDADIRFIKEASRVLRKGGKLCILPLYFFNRYVIYTDPAMLPKGGITFEDDATLYCVKDYRNRHGRCYDVPHFISRIRNNINGLNLTIYVIKNEKEVDPSCYVKFVALFKKE